MIDARWDEAMADGWGRWPATRFVEWAMRTFGAIPNRRTVEFLELGCGAGAQMRFLFKEGFSTWGIDGSHTAIGHALDLLKTEGMDYRYWSERLMQADLTKLYDQFLPHPHLGFDCVYDICTLQHLAPADARAVIQNALEWLKPGGYIFSMWAAGGSDAPREGVPAPWPLTSAGIFEMFADMPVRTGMESVIGLDGINRQHWIIEGRKR